MVVLSKKFRSIAKKIIPNEIMNIMRFLKQSFIRASLRSRPYYRKFKPSCDVRFADGRSRVSYLNKYIYFRIPKAANSSVIACLMKNEGVVAIDRDQVEAFKNQSHRLSGIKRKDVDNIDDFFKFTVVRHPFSRTYSAYLDKVVRKKPESAHVLKRLKKPSGSDISFQEFLTYLEIGGINDDAHWARQSDLITFPISSLDSIAKVENLENDLSEIMRSIFGHEAKIVEFRPHQTDATSALSSLTDDDLDRMYRLYRTDFDNFGYSRHLGNS